LPRSRRGGGARACDGLQRERVSGGHSAGTGFTARYAATDFDDTGLGPSSRIMPLRGLVLLAAEVPAPERPLTDDSLDRIEAKFDGGCSARCVTTPRAASTDHAVYDRDRGRDCLDQVPRSARCRRRLQRRSGPEPANSAPRSRWPFRRYRPNTGKAIFRSTWGRIGGDERARAGRAQSRVARLDGRTVCSAVPRRRRGGRLVLTGHGDLDGQDGTTVERLVNGPRSLTDHRRVAASNQGPKPTTLPGSRWGWRRR